MNRFWLKVPAILYAVLIFGLSSFSKTPSVKIPIWNFDKLVHMLEYTVFGILLMLAFRSNQIGKPMRRANFQSSILGVLYGLSDEIHQYFVPGRTSSLADLGADALGILLGVWIFNRLGVFQKFREA
ncbi:MAG TPA: VanZ family protein [Candidatus Marinimicrobia bacterium]|nr:VanZ family protein [Candidatus Neomarinimicrobiota bacterium]HRS52436.1 VanZ family protein [Candidatus Neomarinimicrobiota bacterium]HRU92525.1 VanZ family protein [Candidatus Neomarinimicrobiota bacterium]